MDKPLRHRAFGIRVHGRLQHLVVVGSSAVSRKPLSLISPRTEAVRGARGAAVVW